MKTIVRLGLGTLCACSLLAASTLALGAEQMPYNVNNQDGQAAKDKKAAKDDQAAKLKQAREVAEAWLKLIDGAKYDESHDAAAKIFRDAVAKDAWAQQVKAVRDPLGEIKRRKVKSSTYSTTLPGAPDGEYVVIQFQAGFANKKDAIETVTPMLDADGKWHVSGYFIK